MIVKGLSNKIYRECIQNIKEIHPCAFKIVKENNG